MKHLLLFLIAASTLCAGCPGAKNGDTESASSGWGPHLPNGVRDRDITDERVLKAMSNIARSSFVPEGFKWMADADQPLPIGSGQTISQPFIVAYMSQEAEVEPGDKVLEIGTGSGYQAAVLAKLGAEVFTIEIVTPLARSAAARLKRLGYDTVHVKEGDGYQGWPEEAPFDAIVITAAAPRIPEKLYQQLAPDGRMVLPLEDDRGSEWMTVVTKGPYGKPRARGKFMVRFVPMTGEIQKRGRELE